VTGRPDLNPWHDAVLRAADLIDTARATITDQPHLDTALRILDALLGGVEPDAADLEPEPVRHDRHV
jgi:hypothetical protein